MKQHFGSSTKKLHETLWAERPYGIFNSFDVSLSPVGKDLSLSFNPNLKLTISLSTCAIPDVEEAMFFLANYDLIEERLIKFIEQIKTIG